MSPPQPVRWFLSRFAAPLIAVVAVALLSLLGGLRALDRTWHDALQRVSAQNDHPPANTAFVLVDEQSLAAMGGDAFGMRWPWPRKAFAGLFAALHRAGARGIVGDFLFLENSDAAEQDLLLGAVAAGIPELNLGSLGDRSPVFWPNSFRSSHPSLFSRSARWGSVKIDSDNDGVIRSYQWRDSLAAAALNPQPAPPPPDRIRLRWFGTLDQLRARKVDVLPAAPFVAAGLDLLGTALTQSPEMDPLRLIQAVDAQPAPVGDIFDRVRGKVVFVGANAAGTFDEIATPLGAPEPGVIAHWTAFANGMTGGFLQDGPRGFSLSALLVVGAAIAWLGQPGRGLLAAGVASAAGVLLLLTGSVIAFVFGFWLPPAAPAVGAAAVFSATAVAGFSFERARRREIQSWFGAYVSPSVVKRLIADPGSLALGGERREVTLFFSDLVGFTALSESLSAEKLVTVINLCLEELSSAVFDHGGYVDKYIGDAVMAVFGHPEDLPNHAEAACRAALDCGRRLEKLNESLMRDHGVRLSLRIGLNTGEAVVGNVGTARKRNFTVLGDAVNLASRLEGANKVFNTGILIGPLTARAVAGSFVTRPVALLRVKGKTEAVAVHEPLCPTVAADASTLRFAEKSTEGFEAFVAADFSSATRACQEALELRPGDQACLRCLREAKDLAAKGVPTGWEPVLNLDTK
ncbi:MAG: adenylate/guanylate cyclase domain-containing protein [Opitutaceae bacterium]|nr:adenylate/guanylate cyclase domain-containing protein [Opitutaceae bacterium]